MSATSEKHARAPRVEDDALVRGAGQFMDDQRLPNQAYAAFVRSPHAHARVVSVDTAAAAKSTGVLKVFTAADMKAANVGNVSRHPPVEGRNGKKMVIPFRPALAETAMHVGEPVVMVVAETAAAAQDGADLVVVHYEELPALIDAREAMKPGAPQLFPDAPGNLVVDWPGTIPSEENERAVDAIIKSAPHVARVSVTNQRIVVASMETRGVTASYDPASDRTTLRVCSQSAEALRGPMAGVMNVPPEKIRLLTDDVGGAFGMKTPPYPEYAAAIVAAKVLGRPVHWMSTRSEAFLTDTQARDTITDAELALDEKGKFLALRVRHLCNQGAYVSTAGVNINTNNFARCLPGMYAIPKVDASVVCIFTNTAPIGPYRGAGRPEANYALEKVIEEAARITGIDPVKLRRKNLIPKSQIPLKTAIGNTYDSGDFATIFDKALELSNYAEFNKRKREAAKRRKYRGIGISCMLEHAGAMPTESASLTFAGDKLILGCNVQSTGQSHASVFGRLVAERLGIPFEKIQHKQGDTDMGLIGFASVGSRSAMTAGSAIVRNIEVLLQKGKKAAAHVLEASESDIAYRDGHFEVVGTDRRISLFDTAARAKELATRGELDSGLDTREKAEAPLTFPNGCHIAEVEIDPETGFVDLVTYTAIDDCGTMLDPMIVEGQVHGSIAQGLGQALLENAVFDPGSGQLISGSFMDYAMPRAHNMAIELREAVHSVPATTNPLGVKGTGEAGTTAAIAAVMNAIADAIPNGAARGMDMPATPAKVWEACQKAMAAK